MKPSDLPTAWNAGYDSASDKAKHVFGPGHLYHLNVAAAHFMPREMACYSLNYDMRFGGDKAHRDELKAMGAQRPVVVIEWAQHDDGAISQSNTYPKHGEKLEGIHGHDS